jgi:hypothetical protein
LLNKTPGHGACLADGEDCGKEVSLADRSSGFNNPAKAELRVYLLPGGCRALRMTVGPVTFPGTPMPNDPHPSHSPQPAGLPPVKPPSARFIVQLFLIPALIVGALVLVFVFGGLAWVGASSPDAFIAKLKNPNPDIRWRAAHELGQVLLRPESIELAANPEFALAIAEQLQSAYLELERMEAEAKDELAKTYRSIDANTALTTAATREEEKNKEALKAWYKLRPQRDLVTFLEVCMGHFIAPVGVHVLSNIAMNDKGAEIKGLTLRRRQAVWALGNLGNNIQQRYYGINTDPSAPKLTELQKKKLLDKLAEIATGSDVRAKEAHYAFDVLERKKPHEVDKVLAVCAKADDIFMREAVAVALNFWDGAMVEPTLLMLAADKGHGVLIRVNDGD